MPTIVATLAGSTPVAVAGAGATTFVGDVQINWFLGAPGGATAPERMHICRNSADVPLDVPTGEELYLVGPVGTKVAVSRTTAPT